MWGRQTITALLFGAILTLVGALGFADILVEDGVLLGLFGVNALHDGIHLVTGVAGLAAGLAVGGRYATAYNKYLGVGYLLVFALGSVVLLAGLSDTAALINLNWADNWLHLGLGIVLAGVGFGMTSLRR